LFFVAIGAPSAGALSTSSPPSFTFVKDEDCTKSPACGDDQPGQKDLSAHAVASPTAGDLWVAWKWDVTGLSGGNTGDACALFDTGAPKVARVNFAICVTIAGSPAAQVTATSPRIYTCGDDKVDRCTSPVVLVPKPYGTACSVNQAGVDNSDPWHSGQQDTVALCHVDLTDVGGTSAKLVNTCSYPSEQPNSDPSDCVLIPRDAFLTIAKDAGGDTSNFNFAVSGGASATPTVAGGSSTTIAIKSATATSVTETLPSADWTFMSAICSGGTNNGTPTTNGLTGITAASDTTVTCTFTNALKALPVITIDKVCTPAAHAATDRFQPQDTVPSPDVNAGSELACNTGTTTYSPTPGAAYQIREVAGSSGSLANYTTGYSAGCESTTGLARGATATCTITNTLKAAPVITIDKVCTPAAHAATDRFQPQDTVPTPDVNAGSELACNTGTTTYSPTPDTAYQIREVAGSSGSLSNYTTGYSAGCESTTGLARGATATCTITNTLKADPGVTINKVCTPSAFAATDRFQPQDTVPSPDVNAGSELACNTGTTTYSPTPDTAYQIREVAGSSGSLSNYTTGYSAGCESTTGLARGATATCTITNTLRTFTVVTYVCEGGQLYSSSVTFDGQTTTSLAHGASLPTGVDEQKLCSDIAAGARFTEKKSGTKTGSVTITP